METNKNIGLILMAFVIAIIALPLLTQIANSSAGIYRTTNVANETVSIAPAVYWVDGVANLNGSVRLNLTNKNMSGISRITLPNGTILTPVTDYIVNTGTVEYWLIGNTSTTVLAAGNVTNSTYVNYDFRGSNYVNDSTSRTVISLIPLFFAIFIALAAIFSVIWKIYNENIVTA